MSASADTNLKIAKGERASFPVTAATTLYKGAMISKVAGYALALVAGYKFDGHVLAQVKNTTAEGYGTAGDLNVEVMRGKYRMQVSVPLANEYMIGAYVYAVNDNTYTLAPLRTPVGKIWQYVSSGVAIVEFDTDIDRNNMGDGIVGIFEPFRKIPACGVNTAGLPWVKTSVNGPGTILGVQSVADAVCSGIQITTDTAENDGESLQLNGEMFLAVTTTRPIFFGCRVTVDDATQCDLFVGLANTDTALIGGVTDSLSIRKLDGSTDTKCYVETGSTETASSSIHTMTTSAVTLSFVYDGIKVYPFVNGVVSTGLAITNLPVTAGTSDMTPSIEILAGSGAARILTVNFLDAYMIK